MNIDGLDRRIGTLEARLPLIKCDTQKFLEKCTVEELRQLRTIALRTEDGRKELAGEESRFLTDLEARYGHV
jgi:hypothetical protein